MNVLQTSLFMYKLYNRLDLRTFLRLNNDLHQHYTRSYNNFHLISVKTKIRKFSLKFRGSVIWNKIPEIYRFPISISSFKKLVKDCLINGYFDIISYNCLCFTFYMHFCFFCFCFLLYCCIQYVFHYSLYCYFNV